MEKALALALLVSAALLLREHQPASAQVFCRSQFNLANEACSMRAFVPGARRPGLPRQQLNKTSVAGGDQGPQSSDDDDDGDRRSSHHHHRHYSEEEEDPRDTACCRRLMGLDNSCVCQVAARLPPFMTSIRHAVTLTPVEGCEVSFECPGLLF